ncbi:MAG: class I SAM-dependent methyltransferase [Candidatus Verstraetearchaeota archaeon]|nr:class I SAM-dependent methyltransferase [Candidatus Verstraetearchaeota archaeon]
MGGGKKEGLDEGERREVMEAFDRIAQNFHHTRRTPWPSLKEIGDCRGRRVLDLGAGTGRNARRIAEWGASVVVAADTSVEMLKVLRKNTNKERMERIHPVRCDALYLPFVPSSFDRVAFIATIHHIPKRENREVAMREVARVTADGGTVVATAWVLFQRRFLRQAPKLIMRKVRGGEVGDTYVSWGKDAQRFYHLFTLGELKGTVEASGLSIMKAYGERISSRVLPENWVVVAQKRG